MGRTRMLFLALPLAVAGAITLTASGSVAHATNATVFSGTVILKPVPVQRDCHRIRLSTDLIVKPSAKPYARVLCGGDGTFTGSLGELAAHYAWGWFMPVGADGRTRPTGPEDGRIAITLGVGKLLWISTKGVQKPTPGATAQTTGTWTVEGPGLYTHGHGTYRFDTKAAGAFLRNLKLTLTGTIS